MRASHLQSRSDGQDPREVRTETAPSGLSVDDMDNLRHMLGVSERHPRGYRNYFVAGEDSVPSMERLRAHGLVIKNERYALSEDSCYHATEQGARFIGLSRLPR
jgi:hypothetical protein